MFVVVAARAIGHVRDGGAHQWQLESEKRQINIVLMVASRSVEILIHSRSKDCDSCEF